MFHKSLFVFLTAAGSAAIAMPVQAQIYIPHTTTHIDYVPHTTTHIDQVRHGNHYHNVPHTTTHLDAVPHTTTHYDAVPYGTNHSSYYGGYQSYRPTIPAPYYSSYRPTYQRPIPHTSTHLDIVPHRGHYHILPHSTSHHHH